MANKDALQGDNHPVAKALQEVLRSSYSLFLATNNYHWNVEGHRFHALHVMFEEQYRELFEAIDEIAERIRGLEVYALPFEDGDIIKHMVGLKNPLTEEDKAEERADMMVANLIKLQEQVINDCQNTKKKAVDANDEETEDLMIARIQVHQKATWMLKSMNKQ